MKQHKKNELIKLIREALNEVRNEIKKAKQGLEALDGLSQLQFIEESLESLQFIFDQPENGDKKLPEMSIARLIIDTWPVNNSLGNKICEIEYEAKQLGRKKLSLRDK